MPSADHDDPIFVQICQAVAFARERRPHGQKRRRIRSKRDNVVARLAEMRANQQDLDGLRGVVYRREMVAERARLFMNVAVVINDIDPIGDGAIERLDPREAIALEHCGSVELVERAPIRDAGHRPRRHDRRIMKARRPIRLDPRGDLVGAQLASFVHVGITIRHDFCILHRLSG